MYPSYQAIDAASSFKTYKQMLETFAGIGGRVISRLEFIAAQNFLKIKKNKKAVGKTTRYI